MKTIAFFNNKSRVGKTFLIYHLAWMFSELDYRVVVADFDPQANLSRMFLRESRFEQLWTEKNKETVNGNIAPLFGGTGDIASEPHIEKIEERIGLLVGDLALSNHEEEFSEQWTKCLDREEQAFRTTTAFARLATGASKTFEADLALIDVASNFGAINRAVLIASDYVVIPLILDLFPLQGLKNVGPKLRDWRAAWKKRIEEKPENLNIDLSGGGMKPLGYIVICRSIRLDRPARPLRQYIEKIPGQYRESVLGSDDSAVPGIDNDEHLLAYLKDYYSLMSLMQEANKPIFMLKPGDGVVGSMQHTTRRCYDDFQSLANKIIEKLEAPQ